MNSKRTSFLLPLLFLAIIPSTCASGELASGSLGHILYYVIKSPTELKVGEDTPVNVWFQNGGVMPMFVKNFWISAFGADINSTDTGISRLLVENTEFDTFESVNETMLVKPLKEGIVTFMVSSEYNYTDVYGNPRDEWGNDEIFIDAKLNTYDELLVAGSIFKTLALVLSATTIAFIGTTAYLARKLKLKQA